MNAIDKKRIKWNKNEKTSECISSISQIIEDAHSHHHFTLSRLIFAIFMEHFIFSSVFRLNAFHSLFVYMTVQCVHTFGVYACECEPNNNRKTKKIQRKTEKMLLETVHFNKNNHNTENKLDPKNLKRIEFERMHRKR